MFNKYLKVCLIITVIITNAFLNLNFALSAGTQTSSNITSKAALKYANVVPNSTQVVGSDAISGWDFTNWATDSTGITNKTANSFETTDADAYIYKSVGLTVGNRYKMTMAGTITSGTLYVSEAVVSGWSAPYGTATGTFNTSFNFTAGPNNGGLLFHVFSSGAVVTITSMTVQPITTEGGSLLMDVNALNKTISDKAGLRTITNTATTVTNVVSTPSGGNQVMRSDGTTSSLALGADFLGTTDLTIAGWIYATGWGETSSDGRIISNTKVIAKINDTNDTLNFSSDGSTFVAAGVNALSLNNWYYVAITRTNNAGRTNFYIGTRNIAPALSGTANQASGVPAAGSTVYLLSDNGATTFAGQMSDLKVYNKILTTAQLRSLWSATVEAPLQTNTLAKGLIANFPLNRATKQSATTFKDTTPSARTGTITAGASAGLSTDQKGLAGGAYDFDGANTKIDTGSDWIGTQALTVSAWIYADSWGEAGTGTIIENGKFAIELASAGGINRLVVSSNYSATGYSLNGSISLNKNIFVTVTRTSDGTATFYVNGVNQTSSSNSGTPVAGTTNVIIGNNTGQNLTFDGRISDMRVWNRVLTAAEIKNLYKSYGPVVETNTLDKGLIANFPLNRATKQSATTFKDTTPSARTGTITAGASAGLSTDQKGLAGGAYDFDGTATQIDTGSDWIGTGAKTISAWVYLDSYGGGSPIMISNAKMNFYINSTNPHLVLENNNTSGKVSANNSITLNTWYYIIGTYSATGVTNLYINGVLSGAANQAGATPTAGSTVYLGALSGSSLFFDGRISDVRVWNRVLTAAEIKNLYKGTK